MNKKVLITGANGYIGSHVTTELLNMGCEVVALDINFENVDSRAVKIQNDIFSGNENIYEELGRPDVCIHFAWRDGFNHKSTVHMTDLSSHFNFINNMVKGGLKHLVVMGSMHEIGYHEGAVDENTPTNPLSLYGVAKNSLRQAVLMLTNEHSGLVVQWIRGYYITGDDKKNHSVFSKLIQAVEEGKKKFPFTSGLNKYDFMDINEMAYDIALVAMQEQYTGVINCCSGKPVALRDKMEEFIKEHGFDIELEYGAFPDRAYDSPAIWGDSTIIEKIRNMH